MTSTEAIRFRQLNDELTNEEFDHFTKSIGRDLITKGLFSYFQTHASTAHSVNKIQSKIIEARPTLPDHANSCQCMVQLPSEMINYTASFLRSEQYFRFARCNRKLYVSCLSPPTLQQLDITLSAKTCSTLCTPNAINMATNIRDLQIKNADVYGCLRLKVKSANWYFREEAYFDKSFVINGLSKFNAIEHLELNNIDIRNPGDMLFMKQWFPMLTSLVYLEDSPDRRSVLYLEAPLPTHKNMLAAMLINALQDQLKIIRLSDIYYGDSGQVRFPEGVISRTATFPKLQSLTVRHYSSPFGNVTSLREYHMSDTIAYDLSAEHMDYIFQQQPHLELVTLYTHDDNNTASIMVKLESALIRAQHFVWKSKHLTVRIDLDGLSSGRSISCIRVDIKSESVCYNLWYWQYKKFKNCGRGNEETVFCILL